MVIVVAPQCLVTYGDGERELESDVPVQGDDRGFPHHNQKIIHLSRKQKVEC